MKRVLLIILVGCLALQVQAQANYRIYAVKGKVMVKTQESPQWKQAELDCPLKALDSIRIPEKSSVRVVYELKHNIYSADVYGTFSVLDYVQLAKSKNSQYVSKGVMREMKTGQQTSIASYRKNAHSMDVLGAGTRGSLIPVSTDYPYTDEQFDELANAFAWIGAQACSGTTSPTIEGISFIRHKVDGEWSFEFENNTDRDWYINVLHVNKRTNIVSLCYVVNAEEEITSCPIMPSGYSMCVMDVYYPDSPEDVYVLVATETWFDTEAMDNELIYHPIHKAQATDAKVQYMW